MAGMEAIPAAREKMVAGWTWIPVESLLFFFPLSSWDVTTPNQKKLGQYGKRK